MEVQKREIKGDVDWQPNLGQTKIALQVATKDRPHAIEARAKAAPVPVRDMAGLRCSSQ